MYIVLSLLNIIRRIINLLIEITSVDLYPSKASASVLSDARDVLRRREIILAPVSRTPGTNRPPNSGMQGTVLALPNEVRPCQPTAFQQAACIPQCCCLQEAPTMSLWYLLPGQHPCCHPAPALVPSCTHQVSFPAEDLGSCSAVAVKTHCIWFWFERD